MVVTDENGRVDCDRSPNWWRCPNCDKANWNTNQCRDCVYNKIWHGWGSTDTDKGIEQK